MPRNPGLSIRFYSGRAGLGQRERATDSGPAGSPAARAADLILLAWDHDPRDEAGETGGRELGMSLADLALAAAGRPARARRRFSGIRNFSAGHLGPLLAESRRSAERGGPGTHQQSPNKAWDATRQSGLVHAGSRSLIRSGPK